MRLTLPEDRQGPRAYISENIFDLADRHADLVPDRMTVEVKSIFDTRTIDFLIDGKAVTAFRLEDSGIPSLCHYDPAACGDLDIRDHEISPNLVASIEKVGQGKFKVMIDRDLETVSSFNMTTNGNVSFEGVQSRDEFALPSFKNFVMTAHGDDFGEVGSGVYLIDGVEHSSGSQDPRLMSMISDLDAAIEEVNVAKFQAEQDRKNAEKIAVRTRIAAQEEKAREDEMARAAVIDDFFTP